MFKLKVSSHYELRKLNQNLCLKRNLYSRVGRWEQCPSVHKTISPQNPDMDLAAFTDEYRSKFEPEHFSNLVETNFRSTVVQKQ